MPWAGFETAITASERLKTIHDLDRSATTTGLTEIITRKLAGGKGRPAGA
jgi:hypothetical protein